MADHTDMARVLVVCAKTAKELHRIMLDQLDIAIEQQQTLCKTAHSRRQRDLTTGALRMAQAMRETWRNVEIVHADVQDVEVVHAASPKEEDQCFPK